MTTSITTFFDPADPFSRLVYPMLAARYQTPTPTTYPEPTGPVATTTTTPGTPTTPTTTGTTMPSQTSGTVPPPTTLPAGWDPNSPEAQLLQALGPALRLALQPDVGFEPPEVPDVEYHLPPNVPEITATLGPDPETGGQKYYIGTGIRYKLGDEWSSFMTLDPTVIAQVQGDLIRAGMLTNEEVTRPGIWDQASADAMAMVMTFANTQQTVQGPSMSWQTALNELEAAGKDWMRENKKKLEQQQAQNGYKKAPFIITPYTAPDYDTLVADARQSFRNIVGRDPQDWELQLYADKLGGWDRENYDAGIEAARQQHYFTEEQNARAQRQTDREAQKGKPDPDDAYTPWWEEEGMGTAKGRPLRPGEIAKGSGEKARAKGGKAKDKGKQPKDITGPAGAKFEDPTASLTNLLLTLYGPEIEAAEDVGEYSSNLSMMRSILGGIEQMVGT